VGTTTTTYTAEGAIKTVTNPTGTTTYTYDPQTRQLSRIDNSNGSSISYTYDLVGRIKTQTEQGNSTSPGYTTEYDYDTFGNLKSVKDPAGGITTMKYDVLNRLKERNLPNGIKSEWTYDELDRIQSVIHNDAQGNVLSSVKYNRNVSGEPNKITREDGTYTKLLYDNALRVTKESFYNSQSALLNETSYIYDAAGKRIAKVTALDNQTYRYDKGYQLDSITGTNPEDYAYDANGRMDLIQRDGKTLDLDHDVYDRLTAVKNLTDSTTTNYVYDGQGRRITSTNGGETRQFLIAPVMGGGLDSTDMMTDANGNLTANYVYAGGSSPFMKLDANGNPVYYLSDGMGSVIGMANQSGQSVAKYDYDSFGNIRNQSGSLADTTGGDFRFQGQWLESGTGIYNFRARDYDSKTGTFLSRDPVDPNEQQPEALNPYQAMYNNPYVYSDPTGMFSLAELNASMNTQSILNASQTYAYNQAKQYLVDKANGVVGEVIKSVMKSILPINNPLLDAVLLGSASSKQAQKAGDVWDKLLRGSFKDVIGESFPKFTKSIWLEPEVSVTGNPESNGFSIGEPEPTLFDPIHPNPDFIIKNGGPESTDYAKGKGEKSFMIGDFKLEWKTVANSMKSKPKQFAATMEYARYKNRHQTVPIALFVTIKGGEQYQIEKVIEKAIRKHGVVPQFLTLFP